MILIAFILITFLFILILSFFADKDFIPMMVNLIIYSLFASSYSINIPLLYILILFQIITFFSLVRLAKSLKSKKLYYVTFMLSSIFTIISLTCSYGYYYLNNSYIDDTNIPYLEINLTFISAIVNGIICRSYLFWISLKNYFVYPELFVQQTQVYLGLALGAIIFGSIFSIIREYLKVK